MEQRNSPVRFARPHMSQNSLSNSLSKAPPAYIDLEEAILGALMLEKAGIMQVAGFLKADHFYTEAHKEIYTAIIFLFSAGDPIDMRNVVAILRKTGKLEIVGGAYYIADLTSRVSSAANIEYHSRLVIEASIKRDLIIVASEVHAKSYDDTADCFEIKDYALARIEEITNNSAASANEKSAKQICVNALLELQARMAGKLPGLPSGYKSLDAITFGFQPGDLIILGGRPSMAKSIIAFQSLFHIAEAGYPVGAFSLEMPSIQIVNRLACAIAEVDSDKIKDGKLTTYEFERIMEAHGRIANCTYQIDDSAALHISDIRVRAKQMVQKYGVKIILIDYIQFIRGIMHGERLNRDQEMGVISRGLKAIAKENNIPVIAISSLNRGVETRGGDKRPTLADLRDSSNIESDADLVFFSYRPEVYRIMSDDQGFPTHGLIELIIAKHRNGNLGTANLKFVGKHTKVSDWISEPTGFQRMPDQSQYIAKHVKNPLPSEKDIDEFENGKLPF